jgi:aminoglycoside phosphotransferase (APT) family kinase protein
VLVKGGVITAIIDWGQITIGDIATDLASFWMVLDNPRARRDAIARYGRVSDAALVRARGWAVKFGVALLDIELVDDPALNAMGETILRRVSDQR